MAFPNGSHDCLGDYCRAVRFKQPVPDHFNYCPFCKHWQPAKVITENWPEVIYTVRRIFDKGPISYQDILADPNVYLGVAVKQSTLTTIVMTLEFLGLLDRQDEYRAHRFQFKSGLTQGKVVETLARIRDALFTLQGENWFSKQYSPRSN